MSPTLVSSNVATFHRSDGEEIVFENGAAGCVTDTAGRTYVDFVLGFGPVVIGHGSPAFVDKLTSHISKAVHLPGYARSHLSFVRDYLSGRDVAHCALFKHSSDSVTAAIRLAAVQTKRMGVIRCGYIGWHDVQIARSPRWHEPLASPLRAEIRYTGQFRGVSGRERVFDWLDLELSSMQEELVAHPNAYSCIVIDAFQYHLAEEGQIEKAVALCRQHGLLVILDETKTSGRVGPMGAFAEHEIRGDFVVLGKAIANGAPLSMLVSSAAVDSAFVDARIGGTFCKELLSVYAAQVTLDLMRRGDGYASLRRIGRRVVDAFNTAIAAADCTELATARAVFGGSLFELELGPGLIGDEAGRRALRNFCADEGVLLLVGHPSFVCLDHQQLDLDALSDSLTRAFRRWFDIWRRAR